MKKILIIALSLMLTSCSTDSISEIQNKPANTDNFSIQYPAIYLTGICNTVSTVYSYPSNLFIGVRYDVILTTPYFDGTTTYTRAFFYLNNAQNNESAQSYPIGYIISSNMTPYNNL